jgi:hypothetical protein
MWLGPAGHHGRLAWWLRKSVRDEQRQQSVGLGFGLQVRVGLRGDLWFLGDVARDILWFV